MGIPLGVFEGEVGGGFTRFHGGKGGEVEGKRKEGDKEVVHLFTIPRNIGWSRRSRFAKRPQGLGPELNEEACVPTGLARGEGGLNLSEVGQLYEAKTTPQMYVINPEGKIIYSGAIDSIRSANAADCATATNYIRETLDAALAGKSVPTPETKPYGCSVKY